jgi:hypothetical protein
MIPIANKVALRNSLPGTTVDGRQIVKVMESFALNQYSNPTLGINFLDEWREYYKPIDQYFSIVDSDQFNIAKYYSTRIRFTVVADDITTTKSTTLTIVSGILEYEIEPLLSVDTVASETDYTVNSTKTGIIFESLPTETTVLVTYTYISRGYTTAHSIMRQSIEWMELYFGDLFKPINGFIVDRGAISDISRLIGNDLLTALSYDCIVACKNTMTKTLDDDYFVPVSSITITVRDVITTII